MKADGITVGHEIALLLADVGKRRDLPPSELIVGALLALCPIAENLGFSVLEFGELATTTLGRYRVLLAQAGAAPPGPKGPPA